MYNMINAFYYSLKPYRKGFIKAQIQDITDASINEIMTVTMKLEENILYGS